MNKKLLKLTIELVPSTSWYNNLRSMMKREQWDVLRHKVYKDYGNKCAICGTDEQLSCHEIWSYDDEKHIQKLTGLIALCELCHRVKHIGLTELEGHRGKLAFEKVIEHFMKVNNCSQKEFEQHHNEALKLFEKRSQHQWTIDIGGYKVE